VTRAVVAALQGRLLAAGATLAPVAGTRDREAYDLYLQGLYSWNRRGLADFARAQGLFERAIGRDSSFAEAWAGLANALLTQSFVDTVSTVTQLPKARAAAERALRIAPDLADAHATLAYLLFALDWNYTAADSAFKDVVTRHPRNVMGHKWYSDLFNIVGRRDLAWEQLRQAMALDPKSAIVMYNIGAEYGGDGKTDSALVWLNRSLESAPDLVLSLFEVARIYGTRGDSARCLAALERLQTASTRNSAPIAELRRAWGKGGYKAVRRAQAESPASEAVPHERARWLAEIGEIDAAFRSRDESISRRDIWSPFLETPVEFAPLRRDPRWNAMRARVGLPAKAK
jgi:adenylate cyclase